MPLVFPLHLHHNSLILSEFLHTHIPPLYFATVVIAIKNLPKVNSERLTARKKVNFVKSDINFKISHLRISYVFIGKSSNNLRQ